MEELHNSFKPMLTPKQMLHKGIFGGTYFSQLVDYRAFPKDWFNNLNESYYLSQKYFGKYNDRHGAILSRSMDKVFSTKTKEVSRLPLKLVSILWRSVLK